MIILDDELGRFTAENRFSSKGPLCVALFLTRQAKTKGLPLNEGALLAESGGQVAGLGKQSVQAILRDYGITRVLAEEGGRTSRGSVENAKRYSVFLNKLAAKESVDIDAIEAWWIDRVKAFFLSKPFVFRYDPSKSIRSVIADLLAQAAKRQQENIGTQYAGTMLQHLVGAKLDLIMPVGSIRHHGASVADAPSSRPGDFIIEDAAIHCTTAPSEALMRKCQRNLEAGLRPIIVTYGKGVAVADGLAEQFELADRVDVLDATQFLAGNLYEHGTFKIANSRVKAIELISRYNEITETCESDPSLRIDIG